MGRIPRYLRVIGWITLSWVAVLAAIVVLVVETSDGSPAGVAGTQRGPKS